MQIHAANACGKSNVCEEAKAPSYNQQARANRDDTGRDISTPIPRLLVSAADQIRRSGDILGMCRGIAIALLMPDVGCDLSWSGEGNIFAFIYLTKVMGSVILSTIKRADR